MFKTITSEGVVELPVIVDLRSPQGGGIFADTKRMHWRALLGEASSNAHFGPSPKPHPSSHLKEYFSVPRIIESVVIHGMLVCLSGLLYEITVMPAAAGRVAWKFFRNPDPTFSCREKSDFLRTLILIAAGWIFHAHIDFSGVYHYIRAQSLLKMYFIFNMLEIIERLVRSWGVEILDSLIISSMGDSLVSVIAHWVGALVYTLIHSYIHFWRVMLVSVAIVSTDSSMFMIVLTNNFAELKGTVFKKYEPRSLYPVITSDIVERMYLAIDVSVVLFRMLTSPQKRKMPFVEVAYWVGVMVGLEVITDWVKYMCVTKFNQIDLSTFWHFKQIHKADILNSRNGDPNPVPPLVYKGLVAPSQLPPRRMNFMATPLAVLVLGNLMLPNLVGSEPLTLWSYRVLVLLGLFLAKLILDWVLIGTASREGLPPLPEKLQNVRAL